MKPLEIEKKIDDLMVQLTLEEKISLCHANSTFSVAAIPRLGIPEFWMSDGPHGVRREICRDSFGPVETESDYSTYLPTGTALSSTWNPEMGQKFGEVLGAEARDRRKDVILGPGVNIIRNPLCGRNFEYLGEDPCLAAKMAVPVIQGIQDQDVAACVKHYAANSQELERFSVDARMDERTLREIYLPAFKAAVIEGGVWTIMGAYNRFRGQHCCHNDYLLNKILKGEWGFDGCVMSDWGGVHDAGEAARNGLDLEMGTNPTSYDDYFLARPFREALQRGDLAPSLLDDKVRRNLRLMFRVGIFSDHRKPGERNTPKHTQAALDIAREAIVLLKNENHVLPFKRNEVRRLVVIGENATTLHALGGGSSAVKAAYEVSPLKGLKNKLGQVVEILHFTGRQPQTNEGEAIEVEHLGIGDEGTGTRGWKARYYSNRDFKGDPRERVDAVLDFDWTECAPFPDFKPGDFAVAWETTLTPPESGTYEFVFTDVNHAWFILGEQFLMYRWENRGGPETIRKVVELNAGQTYKVSVGLTPSSARVRVKLGWVPPSRRVRELEQPEELIKAVKNADAVVFIGGQNHQYDLEACDRRDMALHDGQNELLEQIAGLNSNFAVVLVSGSPVEMPWADAVPAIVQMWYAGMEGGNAIAEVLFGDVNPSGKLPMTFPRSLKDSPAHALGDYAPDVCNYVEGIFVGYRWYDHKGIEPLFPFGHGLSYTTFKLANMRLEKRGGGVQASVDVTNTGGRAGAEVIQIYVGQPLCLVERPLRELKGFAKIVLVAGETRRVELFLPREAFSYWSVEKNDWTVEPGEFVIEAGVSSRDLRCREALQIS